MRPARRGLLVLVVCLVALAGCATAPDASGTTPEPTGATARAQTAPADSRTEAPPDDAGPVDSGTDAEVPVRETFVGGHPSHRRRKLPHR